MVWSRKVAGKSKRHRRLSFRWYFSNWVRFRLSLEKLRRRKNSTSALRQDVTSRIKRRKSKRNLWKSLWVSRKTDEAVEPTEDILVYHCEPDEVMQPTVASTSTRSSVAASLPTESPAATFPTEHFVSRAPTKMKSFMVSTPSKLTINSAPTKSPSLPLINSGKKIRWVPVECDCCSTEKRNVEGIPLRTPSPTSSRRLQTSDLCNTTAETHNQTTDTTPENSTLKYERYWNDCIVVLPKNISVDSNLNTTGTAVSSDDSSTKVQPENCLEKLGEKGEKTVKKSETPQENVSVKISFAVSVGGSRENDVQVTKETVKRNDTPPKEVLMDTISVTLDSSVASSDKMETRNVGRGDSSDPSTEISSVSQLESEAEIARNLSQSDPTTDTAAEKSLDIGSSKLEKGEVQPVKDDFRRDSSSQDNVSATKFSNGLFTFFDENEKRILKKELEASDYSQNYSPDTVATKLSLKRRTSNDDAEKSIDSKECASVKEPLKPSIRNTMKDCSVRLKKENIEMALKKRKLNDLSTEISEKTIHAPENTQRNNMDVVVAEKINDASGQYSSMIIVYEESVAQSSDQQSVTLEGENNQIADLVTTRSSVNRRRSAQIAKANIAEIFHKEPYDEIRRRKSRRSLFKGDTTDDPYRISHEDNSKSACSKDDQLHRDDICKQNRRTKQKSQGSVGTDESLVKDYLSPEGKNASQTSADVQKSLEKHCDSPAENMAPVGMKSARIQQETFQQEKCISPETMVLSGFKKLSQDVSGCEEFRAASVADAATNDSKCVREINASHSAVTETQLESISTDDHTVDTARNPCEVDMIIPDDVPVVLSPKQDVIENCHNVSNRSLVTHIFSHKSVPETACTEAGDSLNAASLNFSNAVNIDGHDIDIICDSEDVTDEGTSTGNTIRADFLKEVNVEDCHPSRMPDPSAVLTCSVQTQTEFTLDVSPERLVSPSSQDSVNEDPRGAAAALRSEKCNCRTKLIKPLYRKISKLKRILLCRQKQRQRSSLLRCALKAHSSEVKSMLRVLESQVSYNRDVLHNRFTDAMKETGKEIPTQYRLKDELTGSSRVELSTDCGRDGGSSDCYGVVVKMKPNSKDSASKLVALRGSPNVQVTSSTENFQAESFKGSQQMNTNSDEQTFEGSGDPCDSKSSDKNTHGADNGHSDGDIFSDDTLIIERDNERTSGNGAREVKPEVTASKRGKKLRKRRDLSLSQRQESKQSKSQPANTSVAKTNDSLIVDCVGINEDNFKNDWELIRQKSFSVKHADDKSTESVSFVNVKQPDITNPVVGSPPENSFIEIRTDSDIGHSIPRKMRTRKLYSLHSGTSDEAKDEAVATQKQRNEEDVEIIDLVESSQPEENRRVTRHTKRQMENAKKRKVRFELTDASNEEADRSDGGSSVQIVSSANPSRKRKIEEKSSRNQSADADQPELGQPESKSRFSPVTTDDNEDDDDDDWRGYIKNLITRLSTQTATQHAADTSCSENGESVKNVSECRKEDEENIQALARNQDIITHLLFDGPLRMQVPKLLLDFKEFPCNRKAIKGILERLKRDDDVDAAGKAILSLSEDMGINVTQNFCTQLRLYLNAITPSAPFNLEDHLDVETGDKVLRVIAREARTARDRIECLAGLKVPFKQADFGSLYVTETDINKWEGDLKGHLLMGPISFVNHWCAANAKVVSVDDHIVAIEAICDILPGEEVTIFEGSDICCRRDVKA